MFCVLRKIIKEIDIVEATAESESRFVDNLKLVPWFLPGARKITYIPKYARYFDSFEAPELAHKEFEYVPVKYISKYHVRVQIALAFKELRRMRRRVAVKWLTYRYRKGWIKGL